MMNPPTDDFDGLVRDPDFDLEFLLNSTGYGPDEPGGCPYDDGFKDTADFDLFGDEDDGYEE